MEVAPAASINIQQCDGNTASRISRTHELLASLDAAKRQKIQNDKMRNMVLDTEELCKKVHEQRWSVKQRGELEKLHQKTNDLIKDYGRALSFSHIRKFNVSRYMSACAQEMQVRELIDPDSKPNTKFFDNLIEKVNGIDASLSAGFFSQVVAHGKTILNKIHTLLLDSNLKGSEWEGLTDPVLTLLADVLHQAEVKEHLADIEEQCRRVRFEVEEVEEQQQLAVESGEMSQTESLYYRKITMQEALADLITKKFEIIDSVTEDSFKNPLKRVHEAHSDANSTIHNLLREREVLKKRCELDLASLTKEIENVNLEDYNATRTNVNLMEKLSCCFKENLLQQDVCWKKIEALEKELVRLGERRLTYVQSLIHSLEQEEKRKVEYQHFAEFAMQHKHLLELTIYNCELAEEVTDSLDEFVSAHCNAIEQNMRTTEREIENLKLEIHGDYLEHFRNMYLTIGDLQYKKEANINTLTEKIQVAHMQQEMHMESLNPKAKEFSQVKKDLVKVREDLVSQVGILKNKSTLYIEAFKPTEQALVESGRTFEHPVETLKKMNESRKLKLIAYHQLVSGDGEGELESERKMIEEMKLTSSTRGDAEPN